MRQRVFARALAVSAVTALGTAGSAGAAHASAVPVTAKATAGVTATAKVAKPYDFNGDGYPDVALGSPYGKVGSRSSAGFVTIVYGSKSGPNLTKKQVFSQDSAGIPGAAETGDHFGYSLTSFDYNKDGYADLLVGAPDEDTGAGADAGSETIIWGRSSGLSGSGSSAIAEPANAGAGHRFGFSLAAGDFDGDGWTDWADTSPGDAYFWTLTSRPPNLRAAQTFRPTGRSKPVRGAKRQVGAAAVNSMDALIPVVGDVNGDHRTDLILGWRNSRSAAKYQYGFDVWTDIFAANPVNEVLAKVDGLAAGDFDGDGYADIATGAADDYGRAHSHVTVFKGDAGVTMNTAYMMNQESPGVPGATALGDRFGTSLSAGDVNHDGRSELAVGVPGRNVSGKAKAGEAIVLYGSAAGLGGTGSQAVSQSTSGVAGAAESSDAFGSTVSLLDVTGDGRADLIAGAPGENSYDGAVSLLQSGTGGVTGSGSVSFGAGTLAVSGKAAQVGGVIGRVG
ncbi:MAG TPA: FG-GAP repeat protein [Actinoplanes sp.]|nr:FG-GAP repeat protein [Actinoplanes sp.]